MPLFLADGITIQGIFESFSSVFSNVVTFLLQQPVLLAMVAVPVVVGFIAIIMKVFR